LKRAKEGYEEQLGPDSEKALEATCSVILTGMSDEERLDKLKPLVESMKGATLESLSKLGVELCKTEKIEKLRALVKRMVIALGEENVVTLETLSQLGTKLDENGEFEESRKVYERCLEGRVKVLGEDHKDTVMTVMNLGVFYMEIKNYEKALECYERALKAFEKTLGKTHPDTLRSVECNATVYHVGLKYYGKAEELYQRALEGFEAQLGKDHAQAKKCAKNLAVCLFEAGETLKMRKIIDEYPHIIEGQHEHARWFRAQLGLEKEDPGEECVIC